MALSANEELLRFTAHWLQKYEDEKHDKVVKLLGVYWTRKEIEEMSKRKDKATAPMEAFIPLALAINPDLMEGLEKMFRVTKGGFIGGGEYQTNTGEDVVNLGDMAPEDFLKWANQATGVMQTVAKEMSIKERLVTIKEGAAEDSQVQKIRDQIEHSKRFK